MHSILVNHFLHGAWYPKGGAGEIAFHTIPVIRKAGGNVFGKAPVQRILLDPQGRACGEHRPGMGRGAAPQSGVPFPSTSFFPLWIFPPRCECQKRPRFGGHLRSRGHFGCRHLQHLREAAAGGGAGSAGYRVSAGLRRGYGVNPVLSLIGKRIYQLALANPLLLLCHSPQSPALAAHFFRGVLIKLKLIGPNWLQFAKSWFGARIP